MTAPCSECEGRGYYLDHTPCVVCTPPTFAEPTRCAWCCSADHTEATCADRKRSQEPTS